MEAPRTAPVDDDALLVERFAAGDDAAFDALFRKYQSWVFSIAWGVLGDAEACRDLVQEVFLQVYRSLPRFRRGSRFSTWLYRIAANRALDAARAQRRRPSAAVPDEKLALTPAPAELGPEAGAANDARRDAIQAVLQRCAPHHRQILALRYYQDMSIEEIANVLACSTAAAKVRLHRARLAFKDQFVSAYGKEARDVAF